MVGWHHQLNGHEFEQTPGDSEGQGSLVTCSLWGCKVSATQQLNKRHTKIHYIPIALKKVPSVETSSQNSALAGSTANTSPLTANTMPSRQPTRTRSSGCQPKVLEPQTTPFSFFFFFFIYFYQLEAQNTPFSRAWGLISFRQIGTARYSLHITS